MIHTIKELQKLRKDQLVDVIKELQHERKMMAKKINFLFRMVKKK